MGIIFASGEVLNLRLPSIFFKYLLRNSDFNWIDGEMRWEDIKSVNLSIYGCLDKIQSLPEEQLEYLDETFVTFGFDGAEIELKPNGKNIQLT